MGARHRPSGSGPFLPHNRVSQPTGSSRHLRSRVIALAIPEALITQARWSQSPLICHKNNEYAVARFLYSWIYGYLDCFHFVTVMNNVFLNLHVVHVKEISPMARPDVTRHCFFVPFPVTSTAPLLLNPVELNQRSLAFHATCDAAAHNAGFLYKKGGRHAAHRRRWSVPRGTMLFCFRDGASGEPVEGCTVQLVEAAEEFAFAVRFAGARARTYVLAAESRAAMEGWVNALSRASFDDLRLVVRELGHRLAAVRAGGPLPPKEDGCAIWSAETPNATAPSPRPSPETPPLPPRRRASAPNGPLDSASLAQLQEWYGQELRALRIQWLRSQAQP
ncbi:LOW QUALITY PROTEIN: sesquipedalian-1-like [Balaenoptera acutorostrata]|uniref:Sesquipedalian n=1 Tax=Balaenoptera acutorostrata TaxID=9767 RepID=A0ABM3SCM3_BALAC|nr:LOW QUALITY PROTEIN: sesquipedalian-1-like [Balaenoptera acutorostrata]